MAGASLDLRVDRDRASSGSIARTLSTVPAGTALRFAAARSCGRTCRDPAPTVPRIPDDEMFQRRWRALEHADRRRIIRAVNRGRQLDDRSDAALAVVMARRQQRFWRYAWLIGPAIVLGTSAFSETTVESLLLNLVLSIAILGAMAVFWRRRAARAEELNHAHARGRR